MSDPYIGEIRLFGFNFAPQGWALCNGATLSISQNTALFSLLGTYYGGNGVTTFQIPDLQSRVAVGQGQGTGLSPYYIGQTAGTESVTLLSSQMPQHTHPLNVNGSTAAAVSASPAGSYLANSTPGRGGGTTVNIYAASADGSTMASQSIGLTGGTTPHSNLQPYLALNYCIALVGIYPSRS